jgi:N-carbamoyl-L-amino-acid hydrolase
MPGRALRIESTRLWRTLEEVSRFGATPAGGLHRLAASAEDGHARDYFVAAAREIGCTVRVDALGNTFVRRAGRSPGALAILIGSHLDSQPLAGRYDGTYGVMAGLEVLRVLHETDTTTEHAVEVVCWTNEEGARFAPAMMGSAYHAGRFTVEDLYARHDSDGVNLGTSLAAIGYAGHDVVAADEHGCYLELHIEQGPTLQDEGLPIGVVTGVQGMRWFRVQFAGEPGHSGTYPMERRRDALVAAAELVTAVQRIGLDHPLIGRATVGKVIVSPNSPNVIPGHVELTVEFRHPDAQGLAAMSAAFIDACTSVERHHGIVVDVEQVLDSPTIHFDADLINAVESAAKASGCASRRMISGAGHDACQMAPLMPTAMIFIPCDRGISHAEDEAITREWARDGVHVLLESVLQVDRTLDRWHASS